MPEETTEPRPWDEAYQIEVRDKLKALSDDLASVGDAASVRRKINEALTYLPQ